MTDLEKLIEANAKAIKALTLDIKGMKRDRDVMYGFIQALSSQQAQLWVLFKSLDDQQAQLTDQQAQFSRQQEQIIELLKKLADKQEKN